MTVLARHKVIDIEIQTESIRLKIIYPDGEDDAMFDHVVMATGHNWPDSTEIRPATSCRMAFAYPEVGAQRAGRHSRHVAERHRCVDDGRNVPRHVLQ